jgi:uncharacterized protein (DUF58 family)
MITPTARAIMLAALGAPLSLVLAILVSSALWPVGVAWALAAGMLTLFDAALASAPRRGAIRVSAPAIVPIGAGPFEATLSIEFRGRSPSVASYVLETNAIASAPKQAQHTQSGPAVLTPHRRGEARIENVHLRWQGPLGLAWRYAIEPVNKRIAITPDLAAVQHQAERLFSRTLLHGIKPLRDRGDGSEFDALAEFSQGMDRRLVEWKQSARHAKLLAKEVRAERNHQIAFAIDSGRSMCEPIAGAPRVDWSINAALLLTYVGLKLGDRVGFFSFDAQPRLSTGFASGTRAFPHIMMQTAAIDYSTEETNYTLGLATLSEKLQRRSMIIIFTDFTDPISAELMLENVTRLTRKHLVVFVTFPDQELETMRDALPLSGDDVSRTVIAHRLLQERDIVLTRLRRLGVHIVSTPMDQLGPSLVRAYDHLRRRERV